MKFKIFKLRFTTPLHISNERNDYAESLRTIHSDTLYAAVTSALAKVGVIDNNFSGDLGCTISSLFPYYQENEKSAPVYFFPKSRKIEIVNDDLLEIHKNIKKVQWIDREFFQRHLQGESFQKEYNIKEEGKENLKYLKGIYLTGKQIPEDFISAEVFPHVSVPRQMETDGKKQDPEPYYMERLFFKDHSGMFFIAEGDTSLLEKGLKILQLEGIGTDRNVGNGFFALEDDTIELDLPENREYAMNLSLFLPENKEQLEGMLDERAAYSFKKRGGWITTHPHNTLRKNRIYMFEEGSVFKQSLSVPEVLGRIADLTPTEADNLGLKHNIYRSGKAIFVPIIYG